MARTADPRTEPAQLPQPLMTVTETATYLGIDKATVYGLMRSGELPYRLVGKRRRVRPEDIASYIDRAS